MNCKNPAFRIIIAVLIVCAATVICFLTVPELIHKNNDKKAQMPDSTAGSIGDPSLPEESVGTPGEIMTAPTSAAASPAEEHDPSYYVPDYGSADKLHTDEFLEILKRDGYYRDGEPDRSFNTDNISGIANITPRSLSEEMPGLELFLVKDGYYCFLMKDKKIIRFDTFGGHHHCLCLWDYDGNGTRDLVSFHSYGSGVSYLGVDILDLTSMKNIPVISRMLLVEPTFTFECKNGKIYIDGEEVTYENGNFHFGPIDTQPGGS